MRRIEGQIPDEIISYLGNNFKNISSSIPYPIHTFTDLVKITAKLAYLNKDYLLFYRGQSRDYQNRKGNSTFFPSIYRGDYLQQRELDYRFEILDGSCNELVQVCVDKKIEGYKELKRKKLIQWSILQHYEVCDTPLLDFTHSLRVASSFALHNKNKSSAFIFVFGLPYLSNRISINSEHDLINIRLLSICPPIALRPYFQEGYLVGTADITNNYDSKSELDFTNRLIAKFEIPNLKEFWGNSFHQIPITSLFPDNDKFDKICKEIKELSDKSLKTGDLGDFLKMWSQIEELLVGQARRHTDRYLSVREAIKVLHENHNISESLMSELNRLRLFRNKVVHKAYLISSKDILIGNVNLKKVIPRIEAALNII